MNKEFTIILKKALEEDIGKGDITSEAIVPPRKTATALVKAKQNGVLCGIYFAQEVFKAVDKKIKFKTEKKDGDIIRKDDIIAEVTGNARSILKAERVALNFLQHLSGISTQAFKLNKLASVYKAKVLDTRKTTPGWRTLEKYAVKTGQGENHRFGLYDMILIKDNHITVAGSIKKAISLAKKKRKKGVKIEVEVKTLSQVKEAIKEKPDIIMLDNLSLDEMEIAVDWIRKHDKKIKIEASGNVTLESVEEIAKTGVDYISVGSALTLSADALDISLDVEII
jgi:nicotinate-nucleotide pyrophosphorylase (carboxylating)